MAKAFSIQDGNQFGRGIIGARQLPYSDIDLTFTNKPAGDIFKKTSVAAVRQSVKNLLMTNRTEKPFNTDFGGNLSDFLFELYTEDDATLLADQIRDVVQLFEPRAKILDVEVNFNGDRNEIRVSVTFKVVSIGEVVTLELNLLRIR